MNSNLASLHAYLCADGYVTESKNKKYKYYHIGLRNYNIILLKDFQNKFYNIFHIKPYIYRDERCRIGSKELFNKLQRWFGSFYSKDWKLPKLTKENLRYWLRSYFDCEAWVRNKGNQDRHIGLDSINEKGLLQIQEALLKFNIKSKIRKRQNRNIFTLNIFSKENLIKFQKEIDFLHPAKKEKLQRAINSYIDYNWVISKELIKQKVRIKKPFLIRIFSNLKENLTKIQDFLKTYGIESKVYKGKNGQGIIYYVLMVQKKDAIIRAVQHDFIPQEKLLKIDSKLYK